MCARDDRPSSFLVAYRPRLDSVGEGGITVRGKGKVMASSVARAPVGNGQRALASVSLPRLSRHFSPSFRRPLGPNSGKERK